MNFKTSASITPIFFLVIQFVCSQEQIAPFTSFMPEIEWESDWELNHAVQLGYFPVTLVGGTPNDDTDDTEAINKAIKIARDHRFVCYLPAGEYVISDQLKAMIPSKWINNKFRNQREFTPSIVGDPNNGGVVIKLKEDAQNFKTVTLGPPTDETIKAAITMWAQPTSGCTGIDGRPNDTDDESYMISDDPDMECQGIAFNLTLKNITIDLNGNDNAVGVRAAGAQGSTIENVTVLANGAYAGFQNGFGEGGGMFNIRVIGGEHGLVLTDGEQSLNFHIAGAEFINQEKSVFRGASYGPSTFTGLRIIKETPNLFSVITNSEATTPNLVKARGGAPYFKGLSIIDAVIHITNPDGLTDEVFELYNGNNFYLKNVFMKGVTNLIGWSDNQNAVTSNSPSHYAHIEEYIHIKNGSQQVSLLEGSTSTLDKIKFGNYVDDPYIGDPIQKHIWQNEPWLDPEYLSDDIIVIDSMAGRDGLADDVIFQQAIADAGDSMKIFIPRGIYHINSPLVLPAYTQLFGPDKMLSIIKTGPNFPDNAQTFMVITENKANAKTSLSNILLQKDMHVNQNTSFVHWQAGKNSVIRNIMLGATGWTSSGEPFAPSRFYQIDNQGGGRWYAICAEWEKLKVSTQDKDFRMVDIDNNQSPLRIYGLNTERNYSDVQVELNNANDVHIYHYKTEAGSFGAPECIPLHIQNSTDIEVHTAFGLLKINLDSSFTPPIDLPFIKIDQADDNCITITNISSSQSNSMDSIKFKTIQTDGVGVSELGPRQIIGTYKSCGQSILECGMIKNFTFGDDLSYYETYARPNGFTSGISFNTNSNVLQVDQVNGGTLEWEVNFKQEELYLQEGKNYSLHFSAKTDLPREIRVNVANYENGFTSHHFQPVNLTTDWVDYEFEFIMPNPDDSLSTLQFGIGGYSNNSTFFRNICLAEINCPDYLSLDNYLFDNENFTANIHIESNSSVVANGNLIYKAGDNILLKENFEVSSSAIFEALIEGCE